MIYLELVSLNINKVDITDAYHNWVWYNLSIFQYMNTLY